MNLVHPQPSHITNTLVLITKQFIFHLRCLQQSYCVQLLENEIELMYLLEENIARQRHGLAKHSARWSCIHEVPEYNEIELTTDIIE